MAVAPAAATGRPVLYVGSVRGVTVSLAVFPRRMSDLSFLFGPGTALLRRRLVREKGVEAFCGYRTRVVSATLRLAPRQRTAHALLAVLPQHEQFSCGLRSWELVKTPQGYRHLPFVTVRLRRLQTGGTSTTSVDIAGGSSRSDEIAGRPLGRTLALFARPRRPDDRVSVAVVAGGFPRPPLRRIVAGLKGDPGAPLLAASRRSFIARLYVVPTANGWACLVAPAEVSCHRGLLRQGIAWSFYTDSRSSLTVVGLAAPEVASVELVYGTSRRRAALHDGVFAVRRPIALTGAAPSQLPPLGQLLVRYRDPTRPPARVPLD